MTARLNRRSTLGLALGSLLPLSAISASVDLASIKRHQLILIGEKLAGSLNGSTIKSLFPRLYISKPESLILQIISDSLASGLIKRGFTLTRNDMNNELCQIVLTAGAINSLDFPVKGIVDLGSGVFMFGLTDATTKPPLGVYTELGISLSLLKRSDKTIHFQNEFIFYVKQ